ncbi:MAG: GNAT family N-acetyltransferase [Pseudomonadota bacterium]
MDKRVEIILIKDTLPADFQRLVEGSLVESIHSMDKLQTYWRSGKERFDSNGARLFAATYQGILVGVAGVTREPDQSFQAMRMRRLYVLQEFRRQGIAKRLALECMRTGLQTCATLTCNAKASIAAPPFWESLGFQPIEHASITHIYQRPC